MGARAGGGPQAAAEEGFLIMKILKLTFARVLWLAALGLLLAGPVAAQFIPYEGEVRDLEGKPFAQVDITATSKEGGLTVEAKTDKNGIFFMNLPRAGQWTITVKIKGQVAHERLVQVRAANNERLQINFKELVASENAATQAARKKQDEERTKFEGMKGHFDAGRASLDQAMATKSQLQKAAAADRGPLAEKLTAEATAAVTELEAAEKAAPPNEPNLHIVMSNLTMNMNASILINDTLGPVTLTVIDNFVLNSNSTIRFLSFWSHRHRTQNFLNP